MSLPSSDASSSFSPSAPFAALLPPPPLPLPAPLPALPGTVGPVVPSLDVAELDASARWHAHHLHSIAEAKRLSQGGPHTRPFLIHMLRGPNSLASFRLFCILPPPFPPPTPTFFLCRCFCLGRLVTYCFSSFFLLLPFFRSVSFLAFLFSFCLFSPCGPICAFHTMPIYDCLIVCGIALRCATMGAVWYGMCCTVGLCCVCCMILYVWCGVELYGVVWCGVVRCGAV